MYYFLGARICLIPLQTRPVAKFSTWNGPQRTRLSTFENSSNRVWSVPKQQSMIALACSPSLRSLRQNPRAHPHRLTSFHSPLSPRRNPRAHPLQLPTHLRRWGQEKPFLDESSTSPTLHTMPTIAIHQQVDWVKKRKGQSLHFRKKTARQGEGN